MTQPADSDSAKSTANTGWLVADPTTVVPEPCRGSIRRTSYLLLTWPDGHGTDLEVEGRAQDLLTPHDGAQEVLATAVLAATMSPEREVRALSMSPANEQIEQLVGASAGRGFRRAIANVFAEEASRDALAYFLLDDLPIAAHIATFAWSRQPEMVDQFYEDSRRTAAQVEGICSGYRPGGIALEGRRRGADLAQNVAVTLGFRRGKGAPTWGGFAPPSEVGMCRRRRIDIWEEAGELVIDAMFRDNTWEPDGHETIVHEYLLRATIDAETLTLLALEATPKVLPYPECPLAAAEVQRCVGFPIETLRTSVLKTLRGVDSCTHLNDMLRSLTEVPSLVHWIRSDPPVEPATVSEFLP